MPIRAIRAKLCQSEQSVPSCVNPTDITPRGLCRVLPAQCLARRSSPAALRRHLSSATPSQLCDAISALRHHLSSATPSAFPTGKRRYLCRKHLWQRCTRQRMIAVIGGIVCARRCRHSNRPRHLLGFVAVVVKTAEGASEVISEVIIAVDARLPHYGRVHCSHGEAVACPTRRVSTSALAAVTMPALCPPC